MTEQGENLVEEVRGPYEERVRELLARGATHYPQLDAKQLSRALRDIGNLVRL